MSFIRLNGRINRPLIFMQNMPPFSHGQRAEQCDNHQDCRENKGDVITAAGQLAGGGAINTETVRQLKLVFQIDRSRTRMGSEARTRALERYDAVRLGSVLEDWLRDVLADSPRSARPPT